jgi:hypothetical protein
MMREIWIDGQGVYRLRKPTPDARMHLIDGSAAWMKPIERTPEDFQDLLRFDYWETERAHVDMQRIRQEAAS